MAVLWANQHPPNHFYSRRVLLSLSAEAHSICYIGRSLTFFWLLAIRVSSLQKNDEVFQLQPSLKILWALLYFKISYYFTEWSV